MSTSTKPTFFQMDDDQFKRLAAFLIALVTFFASIIAYIQSDASALDDQANRDSKAYSLEAFGRQVSGDARVNFDYNVAYQAQYEYELLAAAADEQGDTQAAERYRTLAQEVSQLSPLLTEAYRDPVSGLPQVERYEADLYLVEITALNERFLAASAVKDAWDYKANTYILHLTLLAVALFLFGLSIALAVPVTRWIFTGGGVIITLYTLVWAAMLYARPVFDLRQSGDAIPSYAQGVGLAYQERHEEAIASFDQALAAYPGYAAAYAQRAGAHMAMGHTAAAISDYEAARAAGDNSANLAGELAWAYYLAEQYEEAIAMNRIALNGGGGELWIQFDLALAYLASGDSAAAEAEYQRGMDQAAAQVAEAKAAGQEASSYLWWSLQDAADGLDDFLLTEDDDGFHFPLEDPANSPQVASALRTSAALKSLSTALEFYGRPLDGSLTAQISPLVVAQPLYDDQGEVVDYVPLEGSFEDGLKEFAILFDYAGMQDGQDMLLKLFVDGEEDPSWRIIAPWDLGPQGSAEIPISYAYSDTFAFEPGEYRMELYIDGYLAGSVSFEIEP